MDRARAFNPERLQRDVTIHVVVEVDHARRRIFNQHGRMRCADNPEPALIHQLLQHLQNAPLIGSRKRHLWLIQQQRRAWFK